MTLPFYDHPIPHELTIDFDRCQATQYCRECEKIMPGLLDHCRGHGRLLLGEWALRDHSEKLSAVIVACTARALPGAGRRVFDGQMDNHSSPPRWIICRVGAEAERK